MVYAFFEERVAERLKEFVVVGYFFEAYEHEGVRAGIAYVFNGEGIGK